jgi:TolB-like protein/Tfp pilus assembly protein PilF
MDVLRPSDIFLFENFRLDGRGLFRRDETGALVPVKIGSRALDILRILIERGEVVPKEEILAAVWPGTVVEESNLTVQISTLRRVLDQGPAESSCIRTAAGRGYRFVAPVNRDPGGTAATPEMDARSTPRISLIVLPFASLSIRAGQEYFADTITDDLTADLSLIPESFVIARTTAFTYKGKALDVRQIAGELGVRYVIEGSVRRLGDRVQVNVQLIDGETGSYVWADRFDIHYCDQGEAQSEIVGRLGSTLKAELLRDVGRHIKMGHAADSDSRDIVMRARALRIETSAADTQARRAMIDLLERALTRDPTSIDARIQIASTLVIEIADAFSTSAEQDKVRAEQLIGEALERAPNRSEVHEVMGQLRRVQGRWAESQVELERAIELDHNNTNAIRQLGITLRAQGKAELAIPYLERAIRLEVRDQYLFNGLSNLGLCHLYLGHRNKALEYFRRTRALAPGIWYVHLNLASALALKGDIDEARTVIGQSIKLRPEVNSIERWRSILETQGYAHPRLRAMREKTTFAGLRLAGFPEE